MWFLVGILFGMVVFVCNSINSRNKMPHDFAQLLILLKALKQHRNDLWFPDAFPLDTVHLPSQTSLLHSMVLQQIEVLATINASGTAHYEVKMPLRT